MTTLAVIVFILVYIGMALGRVPGFAVDRTGVALLGLIVLLTSGDLSLDEAGRAVDMPPRRYLPVAVGHGLYGAVKRANFLQLKSSHSAPDLC